jgi:hypothetical protein
MIDVRRRAFLFGASAAAVILPTRKIFLMPALEVVKPAGIYIGNGSGPPLFAASKGAIYMRSDEYKLYVHNGSTWVPLV